MTPPLKGAEPVKAYRYARFSHSVQAEGMSLERQADAAAAWAAAHNVSLDDSGAAYIDAGVSASKGKNLERGALSRFIKAVQAKQIAPGSVLLVESVSRFSRLVPRLSLRILWSLIEAGVRVVFLETNEEYSQANIDQLGKNAIFSIKADTAAEYSANLKRYGVARHVKVRRDIRAEIAAGKVPTGRSRMLPFWFVSHVVDGKRGPIEPHPVYAPVVERIFREYIAGRGKALIASGLNDDHVPLPSINRAGRHREAIWWPGTVAKVLANPAVCGIYQPTVATEPEFVTLATLGQALKRKSAPEGEPIAGYYPRIISDEVFSQVAAMRDANRARPGATVPTGERSAPKHILTRLARCPVCDKNMARTSQGKYLCSLAASGKKGACVRRYVDVATVEAALVANVDRITATAPGGDPAVAAQIAALDDKLATLPGQIAKVDAIVNLIDDRMPVAMRQQAKLEGERDALTTELATLRAKASAASTGIIRSRVTSLGSALRAYGPGPLDLNVSAVSAVLFECFSSVVVDYRTGELVMHWRHGPPPTVVRFDA